MWIWLTRTDEESDPTDGTRVAGLRARKRERSRTCIDTTQEHKPIDGNERWSADLACMLSSSECTYGLAAASQKYHRLTRMHAFI